MPSPSDPSQTNTLEQPEQNWQVAQVEARAKLERSEAQATLQTQQQHTLQHQARLQRDAVQRAEEQAASLAMAEVPHQKSDSPLPSTAVPTIAMGSLHSAPPEADAKDWAQAYAEAEAALDGSPSSQQEEPAAESGTVVPPTKLQSDVNSLQFELDVQALKNDADKDRRANERMVEELCCLNPNP